MSWTHGTFICRLQMPSLKRLWGTLATVIGVVLTAPRLVEAGYDRFCTPEMYNEGPISAGICGSQLSDSLFMVCNTNGFSGSKRSAPGSEWTMRGLKSIVSTKREASDYLGKRNYGIGQTGVVCECCYHKCSIMEMMEYCRLPTKRSQNDFSKSKGSPSAADPPVFHPPVRW